MVFTTLAEDRHELGALMAAVCAHNAGARVLYLGPDLPVSEIVTAVQRSNAKVVGISAGMPATETQATNLSNLRNELPGGVAIWIGGQGMVEHGGASRGQAYRQSGRAAATCPSPVHESVERNLLRG